MITREQLEAFVAKYNPQPEPAATTDYAGTDRRLLVDRWLAARGVEVKRTKDLADGRRAWILERCPFNEEHGATSEVAVFQSASGKLGAECKHNSCQGNRWREFREAIGEPDGDHWDPPKADEPILPGAAALAARLTADHKPCGNATNGVAVDDPGPFPLELCDVGGTLGRVMDYSLSVAKRHQPVLALAGALSLMSVLTGRKVKDEFGGRTNLFVLGLSRSGGGKDAARDANKRLLHLANCEAMAGPERIGSSAGLISALKAGGGSVLFQLDEVGKFLATAQDARRSPHIYNVISVLLTLYSSVGSKWIGDAYADTKRIPEIYDPHCVIYGSTIKQQFYDSLSAEAIADGFLSRCLVFATHEDYPPITFKPKNDPPSDLVDEIKFWGAFASGGNLGEQFPQPQTAPYEPAARARLEDWTRSIDDRLGDDSDGEAALWARASEKAAKLALLHACSTINEQSLVIREAAVEWGINVAKYLTRRMLADTMQFVSENQTEATAKRVLRIIQKAGSLTASQLTRRTQWLKHRERGELLANLADAGFIQISQSETPGRPATIISPL